MKIKLNMDLNGISKGQIIEIKSVKGIPADLFWRRRLADSKIDNCVEIVEDKPDIKTEKKSKPKPRSSS